MALYDLGKKVVWWLINPGTVYRLEPILRYILRWWYTGRACCCPCCRANLRRFVADGICPACGSGRRQRLQWLYLERVHDFFNQNYLILDIAPMRYFQRYCLSNTQLQYWSIDRATPWAMVQADITAVPYMVGAFQVVLCSHVLEHVPEDRVAMREINRLLAPEGIALIQVPVSGDETLEDLSLTDPEQRRQLYGREDHLRSYGRDISDRLSQAGLRVKVIPYARQLSEAELVRYGLNVEEILFVCHKR